MGRRGGKAISGWVVVDKPAGPSSAAVVARVKRAFDAAKAGHAGTLDPAATGVLAVALGEATKTVPFVTDGLKAYRFLVRWGQQTDTDDAEGRPIAQSGLRPSPAQVAAALSAFRGDIQQVPPAYAAVKVDGVRAYVLARAGTEVALQARPLHVARLEVVDHPDADHAELQMVCGKGGYVRAIGRDLGAALGCLGHVVWLRREWSGPFRAEAGIDYPTLDRLAGTDDLMNWLQPLEIALAGVLRHPCPPAGLERLRHGNPVALNAADGPCWISDQGRAIALGQVAGGVFRPDRLIVRT